MVQEKSTKTAIHFIPGDGPNGLIEAISMTADIKVNILTLYAIDKTVPNFCNKNGIVHHSWHTFFDIITVLKKRKPVKRDIAKKNRQKAFEQE